MQNCNKRETIVFGSDFRLKVAVTNLGAGVHLSDDSVYITCTLSVGAASVEIEKADMNKLDDDTYVIAVESSDLAKGDLYLKTVTSVPDEDFTDGHRDEIVETDTGITII